MKLLILTRGLPGSGKSTIAQDWKRVHQDSCFICSTDDYWERPDGIYDFNIELLGKSHKWNQERVRKILALEQCTEWNTIVIVDNTNITWGEMKPYAKTAVSLGYDVQFAEPTTSWRYDVDECFKRNTHDVPYETIQNMKKRWQDKETVTQKLKELLRHAYN